jgi:glycerophosphoryl diester phosphodiesterase
MPGGPSRLPFQSLAIPPSYRGIPLPVMRFARMARRAGATTHVWTVDDPARARRYWAGAVNGIITNDPGTILASARRAGVRAHPLSPSA